MIQGPIISKGKAGGVNEKIVEYDCNNNILKIVKTYSHLFDKIFLLRWENDEIIDRINDYCDILTIKDPYLDKQTPFLNGKPNNKNRVSYALKKGLDIIEKLGYDENDVVLKIRTDQFMDLSLFSKFLEEVVLEDKVYVPRLTKISYGVISERVHLSDYYFLAKFKIFKNFINSVNNLSEKSDSVHRDWLFKYTQSDLKLKDDNIFLFSKSSRLYRYQSTLIKHAYDNLIEPLKEDIYRTIIWRGDKIPENLISQCIFYDDWVLDLKKRYLKKLTKTFYPKLRKFNRDYLIDIEKYCSINPNHDYCIANSKKSYFLSFFYKILYIFQLRIHKIINKRLSKI